MDMTFSLPGSARILTPDELAKEYDRALDVAASVYFVQALHGDMDGRYSWIQSLITEVETRAVRLTGVVGERPASA